MLALGALACIALLAWLYLYRADARMHQHAMTMAAHAAMGMAQAQPWGMRDAGVAFAMWSVMMVAMMTPTAAPLVLMYRRLGTAPARTRASATSATATLLAGYLTVWIGFSAGATLLQGALHAAGFMTADTDRVTPLLGGSLFLLAGTWQLMPLKQTCLSQCRSPMDFLVTNWRDGAAGAFRLGLRHGVWCLGCCWALMLILFAAGTMNLLWAAALAAWVMLEKTLPDWRYLRHLGGCAAILIGGWQIASALLR